MEKIDPTIEELMAEFDDLNLEDITEITMRRCSVKKSRRVHIKKILSTAFELILEEKRFRGNKPKV